MSIFSKTILALFLVAFSILSVQAQSYSYKDRIKDGEDRYLAGAVPEVDGKVVFSETIHTNQDANKIIEHLEQWAASKNKTDNKFYENKVIYNNKQKHELVLLVNDRLIFTSQALNLDHSLVTYYLVFEASNNQCIVTIKNIKYKYSDFKNQETADETISDGVALNKEKTKMYKTYDKFRITTVDMADGIFDEIEKYLNKEEYDAVKNISKSRRENNVQVQIANPVADETGLELAKQKGYKVIIKEAVELLPQEVPMTPLTPAKRVSQNKVVLATKKKIAEFASRKSWAASNYFIVGENIAYVRQVSDLSVEEIDGKASFVCYINDDGTMLSQSQIMPSSKFKIVYISPNYMSYNQLVELSRKYANNEAYTDADISMIEVLLENLDESFRIDHLKVETVPTSSESKQSSTGNTVVITGNIVN